VRERDREKERETRNRPRQHQRTVLEGGGREEAHAAKNVADLKQTRPVGRRIGAETCNVEPVGFGVQGLGFRV
jgi:hypothetical protein